MFASVNLLNLMRMHSDEDLKLFGSYVTAQNEAGTKLTDFAIKNYFRE